MRSSEGRVLFVRAPGLLARAAVTAAAVTKAGRHTAHMPLVVVEGRTVRDACPRAASMGVALGMALPSAKLRCPLLMAAPLETIDARAETEQFLRALADRLPYSAIEPDGADAAFVALALPVAIGDIRDIAPIAGIGTSRNAARALAESGAEHSGQLAGCNARWLWPEDAAVTNRLYRLGLTTYGDVAALPEEALIAQFGPKIGRQLLLRAHGRDLTPVRVLYPPPPAQASRDYSQEPLVDVPGLRFALSRLSAQVSRQLRSADRVVRRMHLTVLQEDRPETVVESTLISPAQDALTVAAAATRLLDEIQSCIGAPVIGLRLVATETEVAAAMTADLFAQRQAAQAVALKACRHALSSRFGPAVLRTGAERDRAERVPPRDRRRRADLEAGMVGR